MSLALNQIRKMNRRDFKKNVMPRHSSRELTALDP